MVELKEINIFKCRQNYLYILSAVKTWRICRKSSLIQPSPLPQPKTGHGEITIPGFVKPHQCAQDLYFNENNRHIYLLGVTLIFFPTKINRQQIFAALPQLCSLQGFLRAFGAVSVNCKMFSNFMCKQERS